MDRMHIWGGCNPPHSPALLSLLRIGMAASVLNSSRCSLALPSLLPCPQQDVEDAEVTPKAPLPPTDTPAGDLALAAKQLSQEDATAAGMQPSEAPAVAATAADKQGGEAEAEAGDGERQHKKRPRIVAT